MSGVWRRGLAPRRRGRVALRRRRLSAQLKAACCTTPRGARCASRAWAMRWPSNSSAQRWSATYRLYALTLADVAALERMAEKSASNLLAQIEASKERDLPFLVYGLGIRHVASAPPGFSRATSDRSRASPGRRSRRLTRFTRSDGRSPRACATGSTTKAIKKLCERLAAAGVRTELTAAPGARRAKDSSPANSSSSPADWIR